MKQATNPFAPVPLWRKRLPGYAAMGVATIALAVGLTTLQSARTTVAGTLLPVSEADAATYGISAVYQLDDGSYRVEGCLLYTSPSPRDGLLWQLPRGGLSEGLPERCTGCRDH